MTVHTGTNTRTLTRMADDIRQLTTPFTVPVATRARGARTQWHAVNHEALLDQLRAATQPTTSTNQGPERRRPPGPRTPVHVEAHDRLAAIYVALAAWHTRLQLPSPPEWIHGCRHSSCRHLLLARSTRAPLCADASLHRSDWHKVALRQLVGAAPMLAPSIADELADAVYQWWRWAARTSGWHLDELLNAR